MVQNRRLRLLPITVDPENLAGSLRKRWSHDPESLEERIDPNTVRLLVDKARPVLASLYHYLN